MAAWWEKNKKYVFYAIWAVVGLFGGNADRLSGLLPDLKPCECDKPVVSTDDDERVVPLDRDYSH